MSITDNQKNFEILIKHKDYISESSIEELSNDLYELNPISIKKEVDNPKIANFSGVETSDIILFITENFYNTLIAPAIFGVVSALIKKAWKKVQSKKDNQKKIKVSYENKKGQKLIFEIAGDYDNKQIDNITNQLRDILIDDKIDEYFNDNDIVIDTQKNPTVNLIFDDKNKTWIMPKLGKQKQDYINLINTDLIGND